MNKRVLLVTKLQLRDLRDEALLHEADRFGFLEGIDRGADHRTREAELRHQRQGFPHFWSRSFSFVTAGMKRCFTTPNAAGSRAGSSKTRNKLPSPRAGEGLGERGLPGWTLTSTMTRATDSRVKRSSRLSAQPRGFTLSPTPPPSRGRGYRTIFLGLLVTKPQLRDLGDEAGASSPEKLGGAGV
jgi:hypothetical protein